MHQGTRIIELLAREGHLTQTRKQEAMELVRNGTATASGALVQMGVMTWGDLTAFLGEQYGTPCINLGDFEIDSDVIIILPRETCEKHGVIPTNRVGSTLNIAMSDPSDIYAIDDIKFLTGYVVEVVLASEPDIKAAIERYYPEEADEEAPTPVELETEQHSEDFVGKWVDFILLSMVIHDYEEASVTVFRGDTTLSYYGDGEELKLRRKLTNVGGELVDRLKSAAGLDVEKKDQPQGGLLTFSVGDVVEEVCLHVSTEITAQGERVVISNRSR